MTEPVSGTVTGYVWPTSTDSTTSSSSAKSTTTSSAIADDKDTFLKLLVAQLKYQDPMKPTDGSAFIAQTAQFTMVEKLDDLTNQNAELLSSQRALGSAALIGRAVTYTGPDGMPASGTVTAVGLTSSGLVLHVGDAEVPLSSVTEVSAPSGTDAGTTATG